MSLSSKSSFVPLGQNNKDLRCVIILCCALVGPKAFEVIFQRRTECVIKILLNTPGQLMNLVMAECL